MKTSGSVWHLIAGRRGWSTKLVINWFGYCISHGKMAKDGLCAIDKDLKNATWEDDDDDESKIPDDTIHLGSANQCQYGEPTTSPLLLLLPAQVWSLMAHSCWPTWTSHPQSPVPCITLDRPCHLIRSLSLINQIGTLLFSNHTRSAKTVIQGSSGMG